MAEARWSGRGRPRDRKPPLDGPSAEGREAAVRLQAEPQLFAAAVAKGALDHPELIFENIERLDVQGFCDPRLDRVAHDMVAAWTMGEALDPPALERHLASHGHAASLSEIARAAGKSGAPFLKPDLPAEEVRALWSQAYGLLIRVTALERALADAKADLERDPDIPTLMRLKADRDALRRSIRDGTVWDAPASLH